MFRSLSALLALLAVAAPFAAHEGGADLPAGFELVPYLEAYEIPVGMVFADDGRLFVMQRDGRVFLRTGSQQQTSPFIDLSDEVNNNGDRGLLGLALHPGWVPDGGATSWVYLLYTVTPVLGLDLSHNAQNKYSFSRLTRYRAVTVGSEVVADLASRHVLLGHKLPDGSVPDGIASLYSTHSNGSLLFAPDGSLMFGTGDGAHSDFLDFGGNDDPGFDDWTHPLTGLKGPTPKLEDSGAFRSQDLRTLAGKIVRVDPETGLGYPSNPFFDGDPASHPSRVWAFGLRNPFRMDFLPDAPFSTDPAAGQPGALILGDVGRGSWEELSVVRFGGENFGWPCFEGVPQFGLAQEYVRPEPNPYGWLDCSTADLSALAAPIIAMNHGAGQGLHPPGIYTEEDGTPLADFTSQCVIAGAFYTGGNYPPEYHGRYFYGDYVQGFIKTLVLDSSGNALALHPFAYDVGSIADIAAHPVTGDLYVCTIGTVEPGRVWRLAHSTDLTPTAEAIAAPSFGSAPLLVSFDGSGSSDPDGGALEYEWDFGDGGPLGAGATTDHTYTINGLYSVRLTVTDPGGLTAQDELQISVGNSPPTASIAEPLMGSTFLGGDTVLASGSGFDAEDGSVTLSWIVDQYHDTHVHPGYFTASGAQAVLPLAGHGDPKDTVYYRIRLRATDSGGLIGEDHVFVYPFRNLSDVAGMGTVLTRVSELVPPVPLGTGNPDPEVIRDGVQPRIGLGAASDQFDSAHAGDQGADDWIGIELASAGTESFRFVGLTFQEGLHLADGGWFEDFHVEVRRGGDWEVADNLHVTPPYPFALSQQPFFDGASFQTYELSFDPLEGDAIRLRGTPGGSTGFISVAELRPQAIDEIPTLQLLEDVTMNADVIGHVFALDPPMPTGAGNPDPETIRNGTYPPAGSPSLHGQFDTEHGGDQGAFDWIGYRLNERRAFARLLYLEGQDGPQGGWFDDLTVEVQDGVGAAWVPVSGLTSTPAYPGTQGLPYETFQLDFVPAVGTSIRLAGDPGGSTGYVGVGELRVFALRYDCNENGISDPDEVQSGAAPDLDGNGLPDVCDPLRVDTTVISLASGGTQTFTLNAPSEAGKTYLVVGSVSGTTPGIPVNGILVPLAFDTYVLKTIGQPNVPPLSNSFGVLDGAGQATAEFGLAPAPGSTLAGVQAHHAFVTLDIFTAEVFFASNAVPLSLVP